MVGVVAVLALAVAFALWQHREVVSELLWKYSDRFVLVQINAVASDPSELGARYCLLVAGASELPD